MLRTDVHHEVVISEEFVLLLHELAVGIELVLHTVVGLVVILKGISLSGLEVLAQGIALEVASQVETAHVGVSEELDAKEIEDLTLQQIGTLPETAHAGDDKVVLSHPLGLCLHAGALVCVAILENIDTAKSFFTAEILTDDGNQIVEVLGVSQLLHLFGEAVKINHLVIQFHLSPSFFSSLTKSAGTSFTTIGSFLP